VEHGGHPESLGAHRSLEDGTDALPREGDDGSLGPCRSVHALGSPEPARLAAGGQTLSGSTSTPPGSPQATRDLPSRIHQRGSS
jgi:hypothetical protein